MLVEISWSEFKDFLNNSKLSWIYVDQPGGDYITYASYDGFTLSSYLRSGEADHTEFEASWKSLGNQPLKDKDSTGREVVRSAATIKGWHYQAHAVEFQTSVLNSTYNKDVNGNDLGFASIKFYDSNNVELTTQVDVDANCVKSVLTWNTNHDFEMISGQLRQIERQTSDIYMYVQAQVLVAPSVYIPIPFTQGGINMRYIGADEPLMTDGRASKLITSNDYFEVVCKHDAGVKHKMTIIFETYKSPV